MSVVIKKTTFQFRHTHSHLLYLIENVGVGIPQLTAVKAFSARFKYAHFL